MAREIDDAWVEAAIASYRRIEEKQESFARAMQRLEVCVRSPDNAVEVVVGADGAVRGVSLIGSLDGTDRVALSRSIQQAISAAHEAAEWARRKLFEETFSDYERLGGAK
ncbi:YbaB/EbfC family nucleoid-associated protein [Allorhizocola rhizosphaerae]|uniref:YbaB/EbfC family nucleoid-associated protein n=1 Tax=Allorhizocola rhizosphaerae TaxID=1872709 RepID=UPI000E3E6274|nr:YbaB/EbfC family nucleoid-associated protein [Allorhizocola rhizosphaerae]